jgi:alkylation response protein AidB-like acyl-CoA dehydrogenase
MEFGWNPQDVAFRRELVDFVDDALESWDRGPTSVGSAIYSDHVVTFVKQLADAGWLTPHWPEAHGGRGASAWQHFILGEEMWRRGEPRGPFYMGINWVGPALMAYGTPEQQEQLLPRIAAGEIFWCQGFSEPDSGSDLASLRTSATSDGGGGYVINGQKIWTSYARTADYCFLLARTDLTTRGSDGISVFLLDMELPGIEVRPIAALIGDHSFNEVFLTDVHVPGSARLGDENAGWAIVRHVLGYERVGAPRYARSARVLDLLAQQCRDDGRFDDPGLQERFGQARSACETARVLCYRAVDERAQGQPPSVLASLARVAMVSAEREVGDLVSEVSEDSLETGSFGDGPMRNSLSAGVAAGTYEIQLNLVARSYLRLARENR